MPVVAKDTATVTPSFTLSFNSGGQSSWIRNEDPMIGPTNEIRTSWPQLAIVSLKRTAERATEIIRAPTITTLKLILRSLVSITARRRLVRPHRRLCLWVGDRGLAAGPGGAGGADVSRTTYYEIDVIINPCECERFKTQVRNHNIIYEQDQCGKNKPEFGQDLSFTPASGVLRTIPGHRCLSAIRSVKDTPC